MDKLLSETTEQLLTHFDRTRTYRWSIYSAHLSGGRTLVATAWSPADAGSLLHNYRRAYPLLSFTMESECV